MPNLATTPKRVYAVGKQVQAAYLGAARIAKLWTNVLTNPGAEATSGTVTVRTNLATDPLATVIASSANSATILGWRGSRWFGSAPSAGTYTTVTGASDGPLPTISTYARKTWTVVNSSLGDTGFDLAAGYGGFAPNTVYSISAWLRPSSLKIGGFDIYFRDAANNLIQESRQTSVNLPANVWTRVSWTFTTPAVAWATTAVVADIDGGAFWTVGETLDGTGLLVEAIGTVGSVLRTNYCTNPSFSLSTTGWGNWIRQGNGTTLAGTDSIALGGAPGGTTGYRRYTVTTADPTAQITMGVTAATQYRMPVTAGQIVTLSIYIRTNVARSMLVAAEFWDASNVYITGPGSLAAATANTWVRAVTTQTAPANAAYVSIRVYTNTASQAFAVNDTIDLSASQWETGNAANAYFDGSLVGTLTNEYAWTGAPHLSSSQQRNVPAGWMGPLFAGTLQTVPDTDLTSAWSGTANNSTTVLRGTAVTGVSLIAARGTAIQSTQWAAHGTSMRVIANGTGNDQFINIISMMPQPASAFAGKTITLAHRTRQTNTLANANPTNRPGSWRISVNVPTGGPIELPVTYTQAPVNAAGERDVRGSVTIPADATTWSYLRLYNGAPVGSGDVWFDDLVIVAEPYTGPLFNGGTDPRAEWVGAPNASASTLWRA